MQKNLTYLCLLVIFFGCNIFGSSERTEDFGVTPLPEELGSTTLIMYYGGADNNLEKFVYEDLNEMEMVPSEKTTIVALVDRVEGYFEGDGNWVDTRAYEVGYDPGSFNMTLGKNTQRIAIPSLGISTDSSTELATDDGEVLKNFVQFCFDNYMADSYVLILPNHGHGMESYSISQRNPYSIMEPHMGICWDKTSGPNQRLGTKEVRLALTATHQKLDLLALDACMMGSVEVIYELRDISHLIVASEEAVPGGGFAYHPILLNFRNHPDKSAIQLGRTMVNQNIKAPHIRQTLTLYDTSKVSTLASSLNDLGSHLSKSYGNIENRYFSFDMEYRPLKVDLGDYLYNELNTIHGPNQVGKLGTTVQENMDDVVILHGKSSNAFNQSTGMSIYFPTWSEMSNVNDEYSSKGIQFVEAAPGWAKFVTTSDPWAIDPEDENNPQGDIFISNAEPTYTGTIYVRGDLDFFNVHPIGEQTLHLSVSQNADLDMIITAYNSSGEIVGNNSREEKGGIGEDEIYLLNVPNATEYHVMIEFIDSTKEAFPETYTLSLE